MMMRRDFAGLCPAKKRVALTGLYFYDADSQGVALCYNMPPLQGFNNVAAIAAMVWEIPAFAGMTRDFWRMSACAVMTKMGGNNIKGMRGAV
ncbi:MAG: hypothetical protein ACR2P4_06910 [Gammaproteobacteria bacterium]